MIKTHDLEIQLAQTLEAIKEAKLPPKERAHLGDITIYYNDSKLVGIESVYCSIEFEEIILDFTYMNDSIHIEYIQTTSPTQWGSNLDTWSYRVFAALQDYLATQDEDALAEEDSD